MKYIPLTVKEPDGLSLHDRLSMLPGRIFATQEVAIILQGRHVRKQAASARNTDESKAEEFSIKHKEQRTLRPSRVFPIVESLVESPVSYSKMIQKRVMLAI